MLQSGVQWINSFCVIIGLYFMKLKRSMEVDRTSMLLSFTKNVEQLKQNGNYTTRIQTLINFMNLETTHRMHDQDLQAKTEVKFFIKNVDYLDCSGLHFNDEEKQFKCLVPFSQSNNDTFIGWLENCGDIIKKTRSAKWRLMLYVNLTAYIKKEVLRMRPSNIINNSLDFAMKYENYILVLELVRSYIDIDFDLQNLSKGMENNSIVTSILLKSAKCMILKECPSLLQIASSLIFCHDCSRENGLVFMLLYKTSKVIKDKIPEKVMGLKVVLFNYTQPSDEACSVFSSVGASCSSNNLPVITQKDAVNLFEKHSNLTLISVSSFKSIGYLKGKHRIVEKPCISLLCLHKGYIPFGEKEFPKQIHGFDVDVQEGYCSLGSNKSIDFGGHIRRARGLNTPGHGSIGGFVDLSNGSVGLITCAHVVFSTDELFKANFEIEDYVRYRNTDLNVEFFDRNEQNFEVCGNIVKKCFPSSIDDISVDAALIELDKSVNEFGFPVVLADQLYFAGFEPNKPPVFTGEVVSLPDPETERNRSSDVLQKSRIPGRSNSVIKYGSETRFTIGSFYFDRAHIRFMNNTLNLPGQNGFATMYNQIEIQSLPHGTFFEAGDSGAFVFCINADKTLSCLGMAIGSSTKGSCLVTPMTRILDSFGLPRRLKPCSPFVSGASGNHTSSQSGDQSRIPTAANLETLLLNFQTNIQMAMANMQTTIETKFENLRTDVRESNEKIQTEVKNLKTKVGDLEPPRQV